MVSCHSVERFLCFLCTAGIPTLNLLAYLNVAHAQCVSSLVINETIKSLSSAKIHDANRRRNNKYTSVVAVIGWAHHYVTHAYSVTWCIYYGHNGVAGLLCSSLYA